MKGSQQRELVPRVTRDVVYLVPNEPATNFCDLHLENTAAPTAAAQTFQVLPVLAPLSSPMLSSGGKYPFDLHVDVMSKIAS